MDSFDCNGLIGSCKAPAANQEFVLSIKDLETRLPKFRAKAHMIGLKFLWHLPTKYCQFDPLQLRSGVRMCSALMINACVGPNGDVYLCQSYLENIGNIITEPWKNIWHQPLAEKLRKRAYVEH